MAVVAACKKKVREAHQFFAEQVWYERLDDLPPGRRVRYHASRVAHTTVRALFSSDTLHVRSAALTYYTVLSLVPLLAFVFAILKGFGAYDVLIDGTIRPYVRDLFGGNEALSHAVDQVLGFVSNTGVASLGFLGLVALAYSATRLLRNIEVALNDLWEVEQGRGLVRQLTDYAAILLITPVCLLLAAGLGTASHILTALREVADTVGVASALDWAVGIGTPLLVIVLGFFVVFEVMPNTRVDPRSAALGALVGGVLWYAALIVHVRFQVGVAKFNALYSSFGIIPIFLAWVYVSWLTVMVGAQVAASHQHVRLRAQRRRAQPLGHGERERLALSVMLRVSDHFQSGDRPPTLSGLRDVLDVPQADLAAVIRPLQQSGLVVRVHREATEALVPGRSPTRIRVKDVLDALRDTPDDNIDSSRPGRIGTAHCDRAAAGALQRLDEAVEMSPHNTTIVDLLGGEDTVERSGARKTTEVA